MSNSEESAAVKKVLKRDPWFRRKVEVDRFAFFLLCAASWFSGRLLSLSNVNVFQKVFVVFSLFWAMITTFFFYDSDASEETRTDEEIESV